LCNFFGHPVRHIAPLDKRKSPYATTHVASAINRIRNRTFSDSNDDITANSLVFIANQKRKLNLRAKKKKNMGIFHILHTQLVNEGHTGGSDAAVCLCDPLQLVDWLVAWEINVPFQHKNIRTSLR